jgi:hypothetical protein
MLHSFVPPPKPISRFETLFKNLNMDLWIWWILICSLYNWLYSKWILSAIRFGSTFGSVPQNSANKEMRYFHGNEENHIIEISHLTSLCS